MLAVPGQNAPSVVKWLTAAWSKTSVDRPAASKHDWAGSTVPESTRNWVAVSSATMMSGRSPEGMAWVVLAQQLVVATCPAARRVTFTLVWEALYSATMV